MGGEARLTRVRHDPDARPLEYHSSFPDGVRRIRMTNVDRTGRAVLTLLVAGLLAAACSSGVHPRSTASTITSAPVTTTTAPVTTTTAPVTTTTAPVTTTTATTAPGVSSTPPLGPTATFAGESAPGTWTGVEPTEIQFSGDSGNIVGNIKWTTWTDQGAVGSGTWGYNDCQPSCAGGTVTDYPATIELSAPSHGQFTALTEVQSGPHGDTYNYTLPSRTVSATQVVSGPCNSSAKCPPLVMTAGSQIVVEGTCPASATSLQIFAVASHATGQLIYNGGIGSGNAFFIPVTMPYMGESTAGINAECQPGSEVAAEATIEYTSPPSP